MTITEIVGVMMTRLKTEDGYDKELEPPEIQIVRGFTSLYEFFGDLKPFRHFSAYVRINYRLSCAI